MIEMTAWVEEVGEASSTMLIALLLQNRPASQRATRPFPEAKAGRYGEADSYFASSKGSSLGSIVV